MGSLSPTARHSFPDINCGLVHNYEVWERPEEDWVFEFDRAASKLEYATGVFARFNDAYTLHTSGWADCCDGSGCRHCRGWGRMLFSAEAMG